MLPKNEILFLVLILISSSNAVHHVAKNFEGTDHEDDSNGSHRLGRTTIQDSTPMPSDFSWECESLFNAGAECVQGVFEQCADCQADAYFSVASESLKVDVDCSVISNGLCPAITTECDCDPLSTNS